MAEDGKREAISYSTLSAAARANWPMKEGSAQWFALAVKPRFDKAVAQALEMKGFDTLLPLYKKHHQYGTRATSSELPVFPGYVCCRFDVRTRLPILTTPGVIQVIGAGKMPIPLSDVEIHSLQTAMKSRFPLEPFPFVDEGRRVRINNGTLAGVEGTLIGSKQSLRLILSISLLQRSVVLEIDRDQVSAEDRPDWGGLWTPSGSTRFDVVQGD